MSSPFLGLRVRKKTDNQFLIFAFVLCRLNRLRHIRILWRVVFCYPFVNLYKDFIRKPPAEFYQKRRRKRYFILITEKPDETLIIRFLSDLFCQSPVRNNHTAILGSAKNSEPFAMTLQAFLFCLETVKHIVLQSHPTVWFLPF